MSILVADCPRCGASNMTFDVGGQVYLKTYYSWQHWYELFSVCRSCKRSTIFIVSLRDINHEPMVIQKNALVEIASVNSIMKVEGYVSLRHNSTQQPPEYVPEDISSVFNEGATCLAVECWNAAGTMFRLCVDLATKPLLPKEEIEGLNKKQRRDLGLRLKWLFENEILQSDLQALSTCIREDGNDGAHSGTLRKADAEDLLDFTVTLLERLYTDPERIKLAGERRNARRNTNA